MMRRNREETVKRLLFVRNCKNVKNLLSARGVHEVALGDAAARQFQSVPTGSPSLLHSAEFRWYKQPADVSVKTTFHC